MEIRFKIYAKGDGDFSGKTDECLQIDMDSYGLVCNGVIFAEDDHKALENITLIFDEVQKTDHRVHLFNVGDIVKIKNNYYCRQLYGWHEITVQSL